MKRLILLLTFCVLGFNASAQFWRLWRKPLPAITELQVQQPIIAVIYILIPSQTITYIELAPSNYVLGLEEASMIKVAKHHMRFREYTEASYSFTALAGIYIRQSRFSEAKWYLLQSNNIVRNSSNSRHLIDNLVLLADIKSVIGEYDLAMGDLQEAHGVALEKGMRADLLSLEKKIKNLKDNKTTLTKVELRYANAVEVTTTKAVAPVN